MIESGPFEVMLIKENLWNRYLKGDTTNRVDYQRKHGERSQAIRPPEHLIQSGEFAGNTTHRVDYDRKKGERSRPIRPEESGIASGPFEVISGYGDFLQKKGILGRNDLWSWISAIEWREVEGNQTRRECSNYGTVWRHDNLPDWISEKRWSEFAQWVDWLIECSWIQAIVLMQLDMEMSGNFLVDPLMQTRHKGWTSNADRHPIFVRLRKCSQKGGWIIRGSRGQWQWSYRDRTYEPMGVKDGHRMYKHHLRSAAAWYFNFLELLQLQL